MSDTPTPVSSLAMAITGSGGAGVMTAGDLLLSVAAKGNWYGLQTRSVGPQIRGGEAAALLRFSTEPVEVHAASFDLLLAVDWLNFDRFAAEIAVGPRTVVLSDQASGPVPQRLVDAGCRLVDLPATEMLADIAGGRVNMLAVGVLAGLAGFEREPLVAFVTEKFGAKGANAMAANLAAIDAGLAFAAGLPDVPRLEGANPSADRRWIVTGNEAAGLGAVRGGVRFAAAYPITPATEILEWLAPSLAKVGGTLVQAEDELSSINMAIGASYGGVPAITATSGPGLALMTESLGLATAAEVPIVVVDVMRGGPSTGIPTKSEQSDLNIAVYGLHGDAPHVVVAPNSISDCLLTTQWAVHLAESMQVPAIVLSDQFLGQARLVVDRPADVAFMAQRQRLEEVPTDYRRYAVTASGVSPMAVPGTAGGQYTADGLEHNARGTPSTAAEDHLAQLDKRQRKLDGFDYGRYWADIEGEGELAVITWGSCSGAVREAVAELHRRGIGARTISVRLLSPCRPSDMTEALGGVSKVLVVEQTHSGQFLHHLKANYELPGEVVSYRHPGPLTIGAGEVVRAIEDILGQGDQA